MPSKVPVRQIPVGFLVGDAVVGATGVTPGVQYAQLPPSPSAVAQPTFTTSHQGLSPSQDGSVQPYWFAQLELYDDWSHVAAQTHPGRVSGSTVVGDIVTSRDGVSTGVPSEAVDAVVGTTVGMSEGGVGFMVGRLVCVGLGLEGRGEEEGVETKFAPSDALTAAVKRGGE